MLRRKDEVSLVLRGQRLEDSWEQRLGMMVRRTTASCSLLEGRDEEKDLLVMAMGRDEEPLERATWATCLRRVLTAVRCMVRRWETGGRGEWATSKGARELVSPILRPR